MAEKQHAELTSYLKFLVQFALANQHFSDIDESEEEGPVAPQKRPDEDETKYAARREKWRAEEVKWKAAAQKKRDSNVTSAARNMREGFKAYHLDKVVVPVADKPLIYVELGIKGGSV